MALSKLAQQFADEIRNHDWSDAPWRLDRAGHQRDNDSNRGDKVLTQRETDFVRTNAMWVTAQVLGYNDPNFNPYEFAEECGVNTRTQSGNLNGGIRAGLRISDEDGRWARPGTFDYDTAGPAAAAVVGTYPVGGLAARPR